MSNKQILFSFRGRIPRSIFIPYWYSILAVNFSLGFPAKKVIGDSLLLAYIFFILFLFMAWILLALLVKRLHDLNRTGWPFVISALVVFALSNLLVIFHPLSEPILFSIVVGINLLVNIPHKPVSCMSKPSDLGSLKISSIHDFPVFYILTIF